MYQHSLRISAAIILSITALMYTTVPSTAQAKSSITNVLIVKESTDSILLEIRYSYDGRQGPSVFAAARMTKAGKVLGHYAYKPGAVNRGQGRTRIELSTKAGAPSLFNSDGLEVRLYKGGAKAFVTKNFDFAKTWTKARTALRPQVRLVSARPAQVVRSTRPAALQGTSQSGSTGKPASSVKRRILPGGRVELRYPDGKIEVISAGGKTTTYPDGTGTTVMKSRVDSIAKCNGFKQT